MRITSRASLRRCKMLVGVALLAVAGCVPQYQNHGYIPPQEALDELVVGRDTRATVAEKVGVPASSGVLNESGYYYVRARKRAIGPLAPREIERQVVAISFSANGVVQNIERFGLEDGQVVPISRRVTSSSVSDKSFLRQLLGNLGRFNPAGLG